jgi:hypothetical protein
MAIAAVTAVLRDLLNNGLIDHNITGALGSNVTVTAMPPDVIPIDSANATTQLNLFLHQVTLNPGWRNAALPSRDAKGTRLSNPPLALDLHYLLTAYGSSPLHSEILLGYAMHLLHENPVLDRQSIRTALNAGTVDVSILPPAFQSLSAADLADQVEQIKITQESFGTEEMSKLWSALQAHYRPTVAYHVSVVLIEGTKAIRGGLPVLTRGPRDAEGRERGVVVTASLIPPYPMLTDIVPPHQQIAAVQGDILTVCGHNLEGTNVSALFEHPALTSPMLIPLGTNTNGTTLHVPLPNDVAAHSAWLPGAWTMSLSLQRPGETDRRTTNTLPWLLAPNLDVSGSTAVRDAGSGAVTITLNFTPHVRPGQKVSLNAGGHEALPTSLTTQTGTLSFRFPELASGPQWLRLRVDGADSLLVNRGETPPTFNSTQRKTIPA